MVVLDNVHPEDHIIIRNVVAAIEALKVEKILLSWTVDTPNNSYIVNASISGTADCEFSRAELNTVNDVNPLRVLSVAVAPDGGKLKLKVLVSDRNEPLMLTETQIVSVRKRARWAFIGLSFWGISFRNDFRSAFVFQPLSHKFISIYRKGRTLSRADQARARRLAHCIFYFWRWPPT